MCMFEALAKRKQDQKLLGLWLATWQPSEHALKIKLQQGLIVVMRSNSLEGMMCR